MTNSNDNWVEQTTDGKHYKVNTSTGEVRMGHQRIVYEGDYISTPESRDAQRKYKEEQAKREANKGKRRDISKKNGSHYFVPRLQSFPDLKPQTAARLIYLLTYADYSERGSYLKLTQKTEMRKDDLQKVLGLSDDAVKAFLDEVYPAYITIDEKGGIAATSMAFKRGSLTDGKSYQRFYDTWVRSLYKAVQPRKHRHLGYIFKLLPYISIEYNVLCYNPEEEDPAKIEFMSLAELCEKIDFDRSHAERLHKIYNEICFTVTDVAGVHLERFVSITHDGRSRQNAKIYVNPRIFYCGAHTESVAQQGSFVNG